MKRVTAFRLSPSWAKAKGWRAFGGWLLDLVRLASGEGRGAAAIAVFASAGYIITRYESPGAFGVGVFALACSAAALMFARAAWERVLLVAMFLALSVWLLRRGL
ncbi:MAG: hypothetical protein WDA16_03980 [Candidatus Thermoplasmatota archaeon]